MMIPSLFPSRNFANCGMKMMTVMIMEWWWWLYIMILLSIAKNMKQNHPYLSQHINITWTVSGVPTKPQQRTQGAACPVWKRLPWNSSQWMTSGNQPFVFQWWAPSNREGIKCPPKLTKLISYFTRAVFYTATRLSRCAFPSRSRQRAALRWPRGTRKSPATRSPAALHPEFRKAEIHSW